MARYDYRCENGHEFEVQHPMSEKPEILCPICGTQCKKIINSSGIVFKGSGFYNTDSKKAPASKKE